VTDIGRSSKISKLQVADTNNEDGDNAGFGVGAVPDDTGEDTIGDAEALDTTEDEHGDTVEIEESALDKIIAEGGGQGFAIDPQDYVASDRAQGFHGDGDVAFIIVENTLGRLTKQLVATVEGKSIAKGEPPKTGYGRMAAARLPKDRPMAALAGILAGLKSHQCAMPGMLPGTASMRRMLLKSRWERLDAAERDPNGTGPLYRGKCIEYQAGKPGLLHIDCDAKDLPPELQRRLERDGGLRAVLAKVDPQWDQVGFVERPSVSCGVRDKRMGVTTPGGGKHLYAVVEDGGDIKRYVSALNRRLWLMGYAFGFVTEGAAFQVRGLIDMSASGVPFWLAFEANAELVGEALEHVPGARRCLVREGPKLDTRGLGDLSQDELNAASELARKLRVEKQPEIDAIKLKRDAKTIARLMAAGVPKDEAERRVLSPGAEERLSPDRDYYFDQDIPGFGRKVLGRDILENRELFQDKTSAHPLVPSYPRPRGSGIVTPNKARWKVNDRGPGMHVYSQAHHGQNFVLAFDIEDVIERVNAFKGPAEVQLEQLRELYALYQPADDELARRLLRENRIPSPSIMDFSEPDDLDRDKLLDAITQGELEKQAGLRVIFGRFFGKALDELPIPLDDLIELHEKIDAACTTAIGVPADASSGDTGESEDDDRPDPIVPAMPPQAPYPIDVLPSAFGEAVRATAHAVEVDPSMAGTVALSSAAVAVGKLVRGIEFNGQVAPPGVYTLVIQESSERKTTTDNKLSDSIRAFERELADDYRESKRRFDVEQRVHEKDVLSILGKRGAAAQAAAKASGGQAQPDTRVVDLLQLPAPEEPKQPVLITSDPTVEGLRDLLAGGHGLVGVFSPDGAIVLGGHSLGRKEGKAASGASYSTLWDGLSFTVVRADKRIIHVNNPRLTMCLGVQPRVALQFVHDPELRDQGLVNRFLVAWPAPRSGTRLLASPTAADTNKIKQFNDRCRHLLSRALDCDPILNTARPDAVLSLSAASVKLWRDFAREMELAQRAGERFEFCRGMAAKAAEEAARIALVLQLFEDPNAVEVGETCTRAGVALARWYADEWLRIVSMPRISALGLAADRVLRWLQASFPNPTTFSARDVYTGHVAGITKRRPADRVLLELSHMGHITQVGLGRKTTTGRPPLARYKLHTVVK
jgi:hypothetical protein